MEEKEGREEGEEEKRKGRRAKESGHQVLGP